MLLRQTLLFVFHRWCTSQQHILTSCCSSCFVVVSLFLVPLMGSSSTSHQTLTNSRSLRFDPKVFIISLTSCDQISIFTNDTIKAQVRSEAWQHLHKCFCKLRWRIKYCILHQNQRHIWAQSWRTETVNCLTKDITSQLFTLVIWTCSLCVRCGWMLPLRSSFPTDWA